MLGCLGALGASDTGWDMNCRWMNIDIHAPQVVVWRAGINLRLSHRDCNIHIERVCQLHDVKITRHGLLHKGLTSAD